MTSTTKALLLAPALLLAFAACAPQKQSEKTEEQKRLACQGRVDTMGFQETSPEKYIDGREGVYKLLSLSVYKEIKIGDSTAYFAGRSELDLSADPLAAATPTPTPTPVANQKADGEKTADPAKGPALAQVTKSSTVLCDNMDQISEGELSETVEAPLSISPKDGKVSKELAYKVVSNFKRLSEKATASEKSTAKSTTDISSSELSPLEGCTLAGSNCKLFGAGKLGFVMRVEQASEAGKKVLIARYRLGALPKREEKKTETPAQPAPGTQQPAPGADQAQPSQP